MNYTSIMSWLRFNWKLIKKRKKTLKNELIFKWKLKVNYEWIKSELNFFLKKIKNWSWIMDEHLYKYCS